MALFSFVQLSDPHLTLEGQLAYGRVDTCGMLIKAIESVQTSDPRPGFVLLTGDLVYEGTEGEYRTLKNLLSRLDIPTYLLAGNHDDRDTLKKIFSDHRYLFQDGSEFIQYEVELPGKRLLCLDTTVPGKGHGALCAERLDWLDKKLSADDKRPVIIAMHHPPFKTHIPYMDKLGLLQGLDEFKEIVCNHLEIERILSGHLHRSISIRVGHVLALTAPSTAHQIHLSLATERPGMYILEPPAYLLHMWQDGEETLTHQVSLTDSDGPHRFRD